MAEVTIIARYCVEDPGALPEQRYRGQAVDSELGMVDAGGATPEEAGERAFSRWRRKWLGVEWVGHCVPPGALDARAGEIAINGNRFALWRQVGEAGRVVCWIMLNPSTASAASDDPTVRRCRGFAQRWGFGWLTIGNLWPRRTPSPAVLRGWVGQQSRLLLERLLEQNARFVLSMAERADLVVCAWGNHGAFRARGQAMLSLLRDAGIAAHALTLTGEDQPAHPSRLSSSLEPHLLDELRGSATAEAA